MRYPGCGECERLWLDYSSATFAHIKAESELKVAALRHDTEAVIRLTRRTEEGLSSREKLREAIRVHEATHEKTDSESTDP